MATDVHDPLDDMLGELPEGITVERVTCHAGPEDFVGERCPNCGTNVYDWLNAGSPRTELTGEPAGYEGPETIARWSHRLGRDRLFYVDIPCSHCDGERTSAISDAIPCDRCEGTGDEPVDPNKRP
jgi:RecJ-like exonuclease